MAASLASSMAQNVYSLNVVGYVNVTCLPGFNPISNPLDATMGGTVANGNYITNILATGIPNGCTLAQFNTATIQYGSASTYSTRTSTWGSPFNMPPGLGVMFHNIATTNVVLTFTGQVEQGSYTVGTLTGPNAFTLMGSPVPLGGDVTNLTTYLGLAAGNGDIIQTFNTSSIQWSGSSSYSTRTSKWNNALTINPGQGFMYHSVTATKTWVSNFTVQ